MGRTEVLTEAIQTNVVVGKRGACGLAASCFVLSSVRGSLCLCFPYPPPPARGENHSTDEHRGTWCDPRARRERLRRDPFSAFHGAPRYGTVSFFCCFCCCFGGVCRTDFLALAPPPRPLPTSCSPAAVFSRSPFYWSACLASSPLLSSPLSREQLPGYILNDEKLRAESTSWKKKRDAKKQAEEKKRLQILERAERERLRKLEQQKRVLEREEARREEMQRRAEARARERERERERKLKQKRKEQERRAAKRLRDRLKKAAKAAEKKARQRQLVRERQKKARTTAKAPPANRAAKGGAKAKSHAAGARGATMESDGESSTAEQSDSEEEEESSSEEEEEEEEDDDDDLDGEDSEIDEEEMRSRMMHHVK